MIRALIVSDACLYRDGLAAMLASRPNISVVGKAAEGNIEAAHAEEAPPDVVLLDIKNGDASGTVRSMRARFSGAQVVGLNVPEHEQDLLALAEAGLAGFVTVEASLEELVATIESAARGEALCSPPLAAALLRRLAERAGHRLPEPLPALTARELELVELIKEGLSNKQIAQRLRIELTTVKNHVHHILGKLGVSRRGEAAALFRDRRS